MRIFFTPEQEKVVLKLYQEGYGCPAIARMTKFCGRSKIHNFLASKGISRNTEQRFEAESLQRKGERVGKLTLLEYTRQDNEPAWICSCDCGETTTVKQKYLTSNKSTKSCGCLRSMSGSKSVFWSGIGELSGAHFGRYQREALKRNLLFTISKEDAWDKFLDQDKKCSLTGIVLTMDKKYGGSASLDRIDSSKGYVKRNIQWIHKWVNMLKSDLREEDLFGIVKAIYEYKHLDHMTILPIGNVLSRVYRKSSIQ